MWRTSNLEGLPVLDKAVLRRDAPAIGDVPEHRDPGILRDELVVASDVIHVVVRVQDPDEPESGCAECFEHRSRLARIDDDGLVRSVEPNEVSVIVT
jgi:hypothetical protein